MMEIDAGSQKLAQVVALLICKADPTSEGYLYDHCNRWEADELEQQSKSVMALLYPYSDAEISETEKQYQDYS